MILVYRPELENPPMDAECTIGFSFVRGTGDPEHIQISAGVTRNFPEDVWERIKSYDVTKNLLALGALRVDADTATVPEAATSPEDGSAKDTLADLPIPRALELVETSFDTAQLNRWAAGDLRIKVRNAIAARLTALTEGRG